MWTGSRPCCQDVGKREVSGTVIANCNAEGVVSGSFKDNVADQMPEVSEI